jgi:hypothetical protein
LQLSSFADEQQLWRARQNSRQSSVSDSSTSSKSARVQERKSARAQEQGWEHRPSATESRPQKNPSRLLPTSRPAQVSCGQGGLWERTERKVAGMKVGLRPPTKHEDPRRTHGQPGRKPGHGVHGHRLRARACKSALNPNSTSSKVEDGRCRRRRRAALLHCALSAFAFAPVSAALRKAKAARA